LEGNIMAFDFVERFYAKGAKVAQDAQDEIDLILHGSGKEGDEGYVAPGDMSNPITMLAVDKAGMGMSTAITAVAQMMKSLKESAQETANKY
jgi:hypothetical protein